MEEGGEREASEKPVVSYQYAVLAVIKEWESERSNREVQIRGKIGRSLPKMGR